MQNLYEILGVSKDCGDKEIKKAYRRLAKKYHPDKNDNKEGDSQKFMEATIAYKVLIDKEKRRKYDETGRIPEEIDITNKAWGILCGYMFAIIVNKAINIETSNLIELIKGQCKKDKKKFESKKEEIEDFIKRLECAKERFHCNNGNNVFESAINSEISKCENMKHDQMSNIECAEKAIELLKNYKYTHNKPQMFIERIMAYGGMHTSTSTSGEDFYRNYTDST